MKYRIILFPKVLEDLKEAKKWYAAINPKLAEDFKLEVNKEMDYIAHNPQYYQFKYKELRQSLVNRFPYSIFYKLEKQQRQIIVFAVLHSRRNPKLARDRIK
ncbi:MULTISPECIES: type II toxin-antitoxin system RelE/ParE family toxin [unclassified Leeuwenhoekiella]|uniref:type II toxin-antitoxin system RelE/ParE family toxin n=1 Tax=unclassified Leeuwenhoekiella TaxID=2615029 RepID=UPI000C56632D|nr:MULTISPECIES: type II toxin-antitoxin system RelE/ParE family toxin [unclassified Leeuwenhoekiella]MAW96088.1 plasmid stabilization protein [Leeuwenhoekiella sp.]MBA80082.1 plasmid stabilization protein [Leeuwenhoekiella sp.]|tara:strand:+ start:31993 stop:32298 length:306 start_codon:yes stop_codon:yes gene_type:complete